MFSIPADFNLWWDCSFRDLNRTASRCSQPYACFSRIARFSALLIIPPSPHTQPNNANFAWPNQLIFLQASHDRNRGILLSRLGNMVEALPTRSTRRVCFVLAKHILLFARSCFGKGHQAHAEQLEWNHDSQYPLGREWKELLAYQISFKERRVKRRHIFQSCTKSIPDLNLVELEGLSLWEYARSP